MPWTATEKEYHWNSIDAARPSFWMNRSRPMNGIEFTSRGFRRFDFNENPICRRTKFWQRRESASWSTMIQQILPLMSHWFRIDSFVNEFISLATTDYMKTSHHPATGRTQQIRMDFRPGAIHQDVKLRCNVDRAKGVRSKLRVTIANTAKWDVWIETRCTNKGKENRTPGIVFAHWASVTLCTSISHHYYWFYLLCMPKAFENVFYDWLLWSMYVCCHTIVCLNHHQHLIEYIL